MYVCIYVYSVYVYLYMFIIYAYVYIYRYRYRYVSMYLTATHPSFQLFTNFGEHRGSEGPFSSPRPCFGDLQVASQPSTKATKGL